MSSIPVGILGATGMVGQQFIALLANHPWFQGRMARRQPALRRQGLPRRRGLAPPGAAVRRRGAAHGRSGHARPRAEARVLRPRLVGRRRDRRRVRRGRPHRRQQRAQLPDGGTVPLLIPEINADHLALLEDQASARGWKGAIVTNPNCATVVLAMALAPLRQFGLKTVMVSTMQAVSGRRVSGRAVVGHSRQRHSVHRRRRRREDRDRDAEDSRRLTARRAPLIR